MTQKNTPLSSGIYGEDTSAVDDPARDAYRDRAHLLAVVAAERDVTARLAVDEHGDPGRKTVLYLATAAGQISHHIADDDLELFHHVLWADPGDPIVEWDGHTKDDARLRMRELVQLRTTVDRAFDHHRILTDAVTREGGAR